MGSKTVRLDEDTYERVKSKKREDETFSEAIDRLIGEWTLLDLVGTLSEEEAAIHRRAIERADATQREDARELLERQGIDE
jgi:predicted CopG family antitoxin